MKDLPLLGVRAVTDKDSNLYMIHFFFEPHISITGTVGKVITVKLSNKYNASDLANALIKAGQMIYDEIKKG